VVERCRYKGPIKRRPGPDHRSRQDRPSLSQPTPQPPQLSSNQPAIHLRDIRSGGKNIQRPVTARSFTITDSNGVVGEPQHQRHQSFDQRSGVHGVYGVGRCSGNYPSFSRPLQRAASRTIVRLHAAMGSCAPVGNAAQCQRCSDSTDRRKRRSKVRCLHFGHDTARSIYSICRRMTSNRIEGLHSGFGQNELDPSQQQHCLRPFQVVRQTRLATPQTFVRIAV